MLAYRETPCKLPCASSVNSRRSTGPGDVGSAADAIFLPRDYEDMSFMIVFGGPLSPQIKTGVRNVIQVSRLNQAHVTLKVVSLFTGCRHLRASVATQ